MDAKPFWSLAKNECSFGLDDPGLGHMDKMACCAKPVEFGEKYCRQHLRRSMTAEGWALYLKNVARRAA